MQKGKSLARKKTKMGTLKIFILHGWTYSTEKWTPFLDLLRKDGLDAQLLKIPGLTEELSEVWNIDNYVEWLKKKVDNEKSKVILIGHSNGGRISLAFTVKYLEKVSNLILIDSAGIYHNELPIRMKRLVFKTLAKIGRKFTTSETLRKALYKISRERDYVDAPLFVKETMQNLITYDFSNELSLVTTPTLIIWGEKDKITPLSDGKLIHQKIKNSNLHIIPQAKHLPQFSHTQEVIQLIIKELKK